MKHYISIIILAIFLFSCNGHSKHWETLSQVESYIEEKPDSALVTLEQIDLSELSGKEEKAKYALLYSMALDKNFIDKTDFELLQPAIDYYEDNGSATDKLRTCYYQGRIYQNLGNDALAMESFVKAISEGDASDDVLTKARIYFAQSNIYYSLYEWDNFIETVLIRAIPKGLKVNFILSASIYRMATAFFSFWAALIKIYSYFRLYTFMSIYVKNSC
ncbi:hypothetical protein ACH3TN_13040 [Alistipes communis]|uniref:Tetratricopeptide repeat protein n=2 Tax=Bacteroidales TaxID=171549 RepID=A0ABS5X7R1_BACUN|nr:hypothetical protein [Bacteroides uniformis]